MPEIFHFQAQVKVARRNFWTAVHARNARDAKDLLEAIFGVGAVEGTPERID